MFLSNWESVIIYEFKRYFVFMCKNRETFFCPKRPVCLQMSPSFLSEDQKNQMFGCFVLSDAPRCIDVIIHPKCFFLISEFYSISSVPETHQLSDEPERLFAAVVVFWCFCVFAPGRCSAAMPSLIFKLSHSFWKTCATFVSAWFRRSLN